MSIRIVERNKPISVTVGNKETSKKKSNLYQEAEMKTVCPEFHHHLQFFSSDVHATLPLCHISESSKMSKTRDNLIKIASLFKISSQSNTEVAWDRDLAALLPQWVL